MTHVRAQLGMTLIEMVIAIVVIGVAMAGLMGGYARLMSNSADPLIYQQSITAANAFMEEISAKSFPSGFSGTCPAAGTTRPNFDDVCDYAGYTQTNITDINGNAMGLTNYSVSVTVSAGGADLGLGANQALKIEVEVDNPLNRPITLTSYRTQY